MKVGRSILLLLAVLAHISFLVSCTTHSSSDNYIDTREELSAIANDFDSRKDSIQNLRGEEYIDALTDFACEYLKRVNFDLLLQDEDKISKGFMGSDSTKYHVTYRVHEICAWLFEGEKNTKKGSVINTKMKEKCPELFDKFLEMEEEERRTILLKAQLQSVFKGIEF